MSKQDEMPRIEMSLNRPFMEYVKEYMGIENLANMTREVVQVAQGYGAAVAQHTKNPIATLSASLDATEVIKQVLAKGFAAGIYAHYKHPNDIKIEEHNCETCPESETCPDAE